MNTARLTVLEIDGLVAGYSPEVDILNGVSITVSDGEIVTVVGPNGAGKSTLMKSAFGLVKLKAGRIALRGQTIAGKRPNEIARLGMGYVPQRENVFESMTVIENLRTRSAGAPGHEGWRQDRRVACALSAAGRTAAPSRWDDVWR